MSESVEPVFECCTECGRQFCNECEAITEYLPRYGYEDCEDGYSDVDPTWVTITVECPGCGEIHKVDTVREALAGLVPDEEGVYRNLPDCGEFLCEDCTFAERERIDGTPAKDDGEIWVRPC